MPRKKRVIDRVESDFDAGIEASEDKRIQFTPPQYYTVGRLIEDLQKMPRTSFVMLHATGSNSSGASIKVTAAMQSMLIFEGKVILQTEPNE